MKKPKVVGGTFTLHFGSVTSFPLRFNASQKKIDQTMRELGEENAAVQRMRAKRSKGSKKLIFRGPVFRPKRRKVISASLIH